jgi:hypothetical protein
MAGRKVKVKGGPYCGIGRGVGGATVSRGTRFAWINGRGAVSPSPGPARHLYVLTEVEVRLAGGKTGYEEVYMYAGHTHARCGCGGFFRKAEAGRERQPCPMCGSRKAEVGS